MAKKIIMKLSPIAAKMANARRRVMTVRIAAKNHKAKQQRI
jgi:hypothetical protein